jgi:serine/threonine-protein kinase
LTERFIDGGSLDDKLKRVGRLDIPTTVRICAEVADGLEALWAAGMVHRDVKPGNIMLDVEERAYLTDFGLAKDSQGTVLTLPGQALGSMDYMAPEQIRGEPVSPASDIYALGCVMFECIEGRPPFADRQGMRVLWAHLQDEPGDPGAGRDEIPPEFSRALKLALNKDPEQRPKSGSEYVKALQRASLRPA